MWPLDRFRKPEILRVGRVSVERWTADGRTLAFAASECLPADVCQRPEQLTEGLRQLYAARSKHPVTIVLESAWMPAMLVDTGGRLSSLQQMDALLRHRLGIVHGEDGQSTTGWEVRSESVPGDRLMLGYGMAPRIKHFLMEAIAAVDMNCVALVPAFAWGWQKVKKGRRRLLRNSWWIWPEQDRSLVARVVDGRVVGFNGSAVPLPRGTEVTSLVEGLVKFEANRQGIEGNSGPVIVGTWSSPSTGNAGSTGMSTVSWLSVVGPSAEQRFTKSLSPATTGTVV